MGLPSARRAPSRAAVALAAGAALLSIGATRRPAAQPAEEPARAFLRTHLHVTAADLRKLEQGGVVSRSQEVSDRREIATVGIVRVDVDPAFYLERLRDIVGFKRHEAVLQIGVFADPPRPADLAGLSLDRGELGDLRGCRVGHCDLKLPAEAIARLQREVRWGTPEAEAQATAVLHDVLTAYVTDYRRRGNQAEMRYASGRDPVNVAAEFQSLLAGDDGVLAHLPGLTRYARDYPQGRPADAHDLIYWSREKAGPSPVISITHMLFAPGPPGGAIAEAVISRQIYGSRYFDASMGLTLLLPDTRSTAPATFVVYLNRSRLDVFTGLFGGIVRRTVRARVRSGMAESLGRVKVAMERESARQAQTQR